GDDGAVGGDGVDSLEVVVVVVGELGEGDEVALGLNLCGDGSGAHHDVDFGRIKGGLAVDPEQAGAVAGVEQVVRPGDCWVGLLAGLLTAATASAGVATLEEKVAVAILAIDDPVVDGAVVGLDGGNEAGAFGRESACRDLLDDL